MKREVPLLLTFLFGAFFILSNFISWEGWKPVADNVNNWVLVVIAFTYVLGVGNLLRIHGLKISRQETGWGYSLTTILGLMVMLLFGLVLWFLPQTEGSAAFHFKALKTFEVKEAVHVAAPSGTGDLFDMWLDTVLTKDVDGDGKAGAGDELECRLRYNYLGSAPIKDAVFSVGFDPSAVQPLDPGTARTVPTESSTPAQDSASNGESPARASSSSAPASTAGGESAESPDSIAKSRAAEPPPSNPDGRGATPDGEGTAQGAPPSAAAAGATPVAVPPTPPPGHAAPTPGGFVWNAGAIDTSWFGRAHAGNGETSVYTWFYDAVYVPMQSTMFALLAFFISSAAFRAFRIRSANAVLLGVAALVVILGSVPVGEAVWPQFPTLVAWVMNCLQTAGKRAILIGAALGAIATGLKMIVGAEKGYLSRD